MLGSEKDIAMLFASKQLHYFITTTQMLCLTKAAERLCITPSPLGRSIMQLEERLGYKLFVRLPEGLRLTPQGEALYQDVYPFYQRLLELEQQHRTGVAAPLHTLKMATDGLYSGFCTTLADKLSALIPAQYLQMQILPVEAMLTALRNHQIDCCLVSDPLLEERGLHKRPLPQESLKLAVSAELASACAVTLMQELPLAQYNVVPDNGHARRVLDWLHKVGITPKVLRFPEMAQRLRMVRQGLAVSLVPHSVSRILQDTEIRLLDLPDGGPALRRYVYCLQSNYSQLQDPLSLLDASLEHWLNPALHVPV
ncbi:LysR family transcriptional regulator [Serratia marcescens]|nr:LysR family transcriptional regulator [Serratia marcescens]